MHKIKASCARLLPCALIFLGLVMAVLTSLRAVWSNPLPMAAWGLIVAGGLLLGTLPLFLGLIVVMPVLGHATWHLYRKAVA